jgi:hypothetical protein
VCFRPEDVRICRGGKANEDVFRATISSIEFLGPFWRAMLKIPKLGQNDLIVDFSSNDTRDLALRDGGSIDIILPASTLRVFRVDPRDKSISKQLAVY